MGKYKVCFILDGAMEKTYEVAITEYATQGIQLFENMTDESLAVELAFREMLDEQEFYAGSTIGIQSVEEVQ